MRTLLELALLEAFEEIKLPHTWSLVDQPKDSRAFCSVCIEFHSYEHMKHYGQNSTIASYIVCELLEIDDKYTLRMTEETYVKIDNKLYQTLGSRTQSTRLYTDTMIDSAKEYLIYRVNSSIVSNYLATSLIVGRVVYVNLCRDCTSPI